MQQVYANCILWCNEHMHNNWLMVWNNAKCQTKKINSLLVPKRTWISYSIDNNLKKISWVSSHIWLNTAFKLHKCVYSYYILQCIFMKTVDFLEKTIQNSFLCNLIFAFFNVLFKSFCLPYLISYYLLSFRQIYIDF